MESNWRYNVALFGLSYTDVRLLARLQSDPDFMISNGFNATTYRIWLASSLVDVPDAVPIAFGDIPPGHPHFPYGVLVEPDVPV